MSSEFDPYRIWLGIPVSEQPANLYRLLGLALFESDDDVISNAADRQMAHVRTFQAGKYSEQSQKLLNELSAARVTLLDKKKKAEYDAKLKSELESSAGSSMVNLGNAPLPPQGSFIGGQSSVNLSPPPPINGPEGSLLGVNLGLSSTKKKSGSSDRKAGFGAADKSGKGPLTTSSSSRRTASKKKSNVGAIAGVVGGIAVLVILALVFMTNSSTKTATEEVYDPNDYSQSELFKERERMTKAPQAPQQHKKDKPKKNKESKKNNELEITPPPIDVTLPPPEPPVPGENADSESTTPNDASGGTDVPVDFTQLAATPGQVKVYDKFQAKPIEPFLLFLDGVKAKPTVKAIHQSADSSHLLVGSPDTVKTSVVDIATGKESFSLVPPSTVGVFADCKETADKKMYLLAVNPIKSTLREYASLLRSDELLSQSESDLKNFQKPKSLIFRYDATGQLKEEKDAIDKAFVKFDDGYQILQIAPPLNSETDSLAVALTDGLIHIVNVETRSDWMQFYPSDSEVPTPVWINIDASKNDKDVFKKIFKVIQPSVVPTTMTFQSDKYLATGNSQGEAFVWNLEQYSPASETTISSLQRVEHEFAAKESKSAVISMRFDSEGKKLYIFWADGHVGVWDWKSNQLIQKGFVEQNVKYAQILADKYLLVQNDKGEVSIWSWDSPKVKQIGIFKFLTEQVIADPEQLLFWATKQGASGSNLTMYALPTDFVEAMKNPEFANLFKPIIIYSVPEESLWKAKLAKMEQKINDQIKDKTDEQKKALIRQYVGKMPDNTTMDPESRYAFYQACISAMVQLKEVKDKVQALELVDGVARDFEVDKSMLKLDVYEQLIEKTDKFKIPLIANDLLHFCKELLNGNNSRERKERIKEILTKLINKDSASGITEQARSLRNKCN